MLVLALILLTVTVCSGEARRYVRIAICKDKKNITLQIDGSYVITTLYTGQLLERGESLVKQKVIPTSSGVDIGDRAFGVFAAHIEVDKNTAVSVNDRHFRGSIDIIRTEQKKLLVVNYIDVDEYLCGVLCNEISPKWGIEAIKAQTIAARTFALYQTIINVEKEYDMTADVYSQVYGGKTSENERLNKAVHETKNIVMMFKNNIFPAYYHATCSGRTEDASILWKIDIAPLKSVNCVFCKESPYYQWETRISLADIGQRLTKNGYYTREIESIIPLDRDESGRITKVNIDGLVIAAAKFRLAVGPDILRSTNFRVFFDSDNVIFTGYGWGHGVGLCQWGAKKMAEKGYTAEKILKHYYPEADIVKIQ